MGPFRLLFRFPFAAHGPGDANVISSFIWQSSQKPPPATFGAENPVFSLIRSCCVLLFGQVLGQELGDWLKHWPVIC